MEVVRGELEWVLGVGPEMWKIGDGAWEVVGGKWEVGHSKRTLSQTWEVV